MVGGAAPSLHGVGGVAPQVVARPAADTGHLRHLAQVFLDAAEEVSTAESDGSAIPARGAAVAMALAAAYGPSPASAGASPPARSGPGSGTFLGLPHAGRQQRNGARCDGRRQPHRSPDAVAAEAARWTWAPRGGLDAGNTPATAIATRRVTPVLGAPLVDWERAESVGLVLRICRGGLDGWPRLLDPFLGHRQRPQSISPPATGACGRQTPAALRGARGAASFPENAADGHRCRPPLQGTFVAEMVPTRAARGPPTPAARHLHPQHPRGRQGLDAHLAAVRGRHPAGVRGAPRELPDGMRRQRPERGDGSDTAAVLRHEQGAGGAPARQGRSCLVKSGVLGWMRCFTRALSKAQGQQALNASVRLSRYVLPRHPPPAQCSLPWRVHALTTPQIATFLEEPTRISPSSAPKWAALEIQLQVATAHTYSNACQWHS